MRTKTRQGTLLLGILLFFLCAVFVQAELLICNQCGYEMSSGSKFCSHCGAKVGDAGTDTGVSGAVAPDKKEGPDVAPGEGRREAKIETKLVEEEYERAKKHLEAGHAWHALFYCRNAMALNMLVDPDEERSRRLLELQIGCEAQFGSADRECPVCKGTGKAERTMDTVSAKGTLTQYSLPDKSKSTCMACVGKGRLTGRIGLRKLRMSYGTAVKEYSILRESSGWMPVGAAWIPALLDGKLSNRQTAVLKRTTGARCEACLGFGQAACGSCEGTGREKCTNRDCVGGYVTQEIESKLTGAAGRVMRVKCPICGGAAWVPCVSCSGAGKMICGSCEGTGKRPECQACDGSGLKTCRKCKGSGTYRKAVCPTCAGDGVTLCTSCNGDGRSDKADR